jgi:hypothetical protein
MPGPRNHVGRPREWKTVIGDQLLGTCAIRPLSKQDARIRLPLWQRCAAVEIFLTRDRRLRIW